MIAIDELDNPDRERAEADFGGPVIRCRGCLEHLPADADFFYRDRRRSHLGLDTICKVCWKEGYRRKPRELS